MLNHVQDFQWAVIGAGPAGIAAIGQLLDTHIPSEQIVWLDPDFNAGDFGSKWTKVSSNTSVKLFNRFYHHCTSFNFKTVAHQFQINHFDEQDTCLLEYAAQPLKWITQSLRQKIFTLQKKARHLELKEHYWHISIIGPDNDTNTEIIKAKNVILAIGSEPKTVLFNHLYEIPLTIALDPESLSQACDTDDIIAVFGSSHSAIIILKSLLEYTNVRRIINFYQHPLRYAIYFDDWILFDDTGLKGSTAKWAKEHLHGTMPDRLTRKMVGPESIDTYLPQCTKAIYPIGFNRRSITIDGMSSLNYNEHNGIIAPGLFGLGIAFPEAAIDRYGTLEYRVGLWKFMDYLSRILPVWLQYHI
jgi:hypothetical protein